MERLNESLVVVGVLVFLLGLFSTGIRRYWLSEPLLALALGVALGPVAVDFLGLSYAQFDQYAVLEEGSRLALAVGLMGSALRIPPSKFLRLGWAITFMLGIIMPLMWVISGFLVYLIFGLPVWLSLLIGAALTPTDPVLATAITSGATARRNLPDRLRYLISAESGLNDGLGFPIVFLAILILTEPLYRLPFDWLLVIVLWDVVGGAVFGAIVGYAAGWLVRRAEQEREVLEIFVYSYTVALALLTLGASKLMGMDGILSVFIAGIFFSIAYRGSARVLEEESEGAVARFFILPVFFLVGLLVPWQGWLSLGWNGLAIVAAILLLRRLPAVLALGFLVREIEAWQDRAFVGWFGPIGVSAVFYATLGVRHTGDVVIWWISSLVVVASVVAFGVTATPATTYYGSHFRRGEEGGGPTEHEEATREMEELEAGEDDGRGPHGGQRERAGRRPGGDDGAGQTGG